MGLLEDMLAGAGSETGVDPLAKMVSEMVLGQGDPIADPKSSTLNKVLLGLGGAGGLVGGGGPKGALSAITPAGWRNMVPEAKAMITEFGNQFPEWFGSVLKHPKELLVNTAENLGLGTYGTFENLNPLLDRINLLRRPGLFGRETRAGADTIGHELTHYLTAGKLNKMPPEDAATIGMLLSDILPPRGQGSLKYRLGQYETTKPLMDVFKGKALPPRAEDMFNELQRSIGSEGLAHLAERTVFPETSSKLQDLARKLGVGAKASTPTAGSTLLDDVLESLKQLRGNR